MKRLFFPAFSLLYRMSLLRYRFSSLGLFLWVVLWFTAALGIDTKATMLHQLFLFLLALFVLSLMSVCLSRFKKMKLVVRRQLPSFVTVGEPFQYHIWVKNHTNKALCSLQVRENITYPKPDFKSFCQALEPDEYKRNRFDRDIGYYRFVWLHRQGRGLDMKCVDVGMIDAQQQLRVTLEATAVRRGYISLNEMYFYRPEALGLLLQRCRAKCMGKLLVLPRRYRLSSQFHIKGARQAQKGTMSLASNIGESDEFHTLRAYQPGDSPRHIHWPSWAKTHQPMVKQFQDEHVVRQALLLDSFACEATKQDPQIFEEAISVAASFAANVDTGESLLDLMFIGDCCQNLSIGRSLAHAEQMLEVLASINLCHDQRFLRLHQFMMQHVPVLSSCILVLLDWGKERQDLVQQLQAANISVTVLLFLSKEAPEPQPGVMQSYRRHFKCLRMGEVEQGLHLI